MVKEIHHHRTSFYLKNDNIFKSELNNIDEWVAKVVNQEEYWKTEEKLINTEDAQTSAENFAVDILYTAGINPYEYIKNGFYQILLESLPVWPATLLSAILLFF